MILKVYLTLEICAVVLNAVYMVSVWKKSNVGKTFKYFLSVLTCANIITNIMCLVFDVSTTLGLTVRSNVCLALIILVPACFVTTLGTVTAIGIERLVAIRRPRKYKTLYTQKNTVLMITGIVLCSLSVSLTVLPDFLDNESGMCLPLDLYPRRYGNLFLGFCFMVLLVIVNITMVYLIYSLTSFAQHSLRSPEVARKALIASRIALGSAVFYSVCCGTTTAYLFWIQFSDCDNYCVATNDFTFVASSLLNVFSLGDPVIYFLSLIHWKACKNRSKIHATQTAESGGKSSTPFPGSASANNIRIDERLGSTNIQDNNVTNGSESQTKVCAAASSSV